MKKRTPLVIALSAACLISLSGCSEDPAFTAESVAQFEKQYFTFMDGMSKVERDQYELAITALTLYVEAQSSPAEIRQGNHLLDLAYAIRGNTPAQVIEMANEHRFTEYRELAMQLIIFEREPEWADDEPQSSTIEVNSNTDDSVITASSQVISDRDTALDTIQGVRIIEAVAALEDGLPIYKVMLENDTEHALKEVTLTLGLINEQQQPLGDQKLTYIFPSPLMTGELHQMNVRLNRPGDTHGDEDHWFSEASMLGEVISLRTAKGIEFSKTK